MKNLKNLVAVAAIVIGITALAYAGEYYIDYLKSDVVIVMRTLGIGTMSPSGDYKVDMVGNARLVGNVAMTGNPAVTGNLSVSGQMLMPSVSSTTIATLVPAAVGAVIYNNTRHTICIGTAAVAGAWVFASTNGVTTAGLTCKE